MRLHRARTAEELTARNVDTIAQIETAAQQARTFGDRVADVFARTVGSWGFIITQSTFLFFWIVLNVAPGIPHWDPYPFILLNLALSFQAAYSSPIIMMSQNRQARLSERRNHLDLQINLLAEQENTEMLRLLRKICDRLEISVKHDPNIDLLGQITRPENLIRQIDQVDEEQKRVDREKQEKERGKGNRKEEGPSK